MDCVQVRKDFPDMRQNERRIEFIREGDALRTAGLPPDRAGRADCWNSRPAQGRTNPFLGLVADFYGLKTEEIPAGRHQVIG